jgi:hypothetical protein
MHRSLLYRSRALVVRSQCLLRRVAKAAPATALARHGQRSEVAFESGRRHVVLDRRNAGPSTGADFRLESSQPGVREEDCTTFSTRTCGALVIQDSGVSAR